MVYQASLFIRREGVRWGVEFLEELLDDAGQSLAAHLEQGAAGLADQLVGFEG